MLKSLNVAQSGLSAAKIAVENVSNNIANENTPGYKKRVVQLSELELIDGRMTGRGVRADEAQRITSEYMYDNLLGEYSKANYLNEVSSMVGNIEAMFQETDFSGFSSDVDRYFQAVEDLRSNPNSEIYRTTYQNQGKVVVDSLQNLYSNIEKQEQLTRLSLEQNVEKINNLVNEIGSVNQQLGQHRIASHDLLDKRDQLEKELSEYVDIDVDRSNDEYTLRVGGAIAVRFNTNIREINIIEDDTAQIDRFSIADANNNVFDGIKNIQNSDGSIESRTFMPGDIVTYKLNNEHEVSVAMGKPIYEADGITKVDINGDNIIDDSDNVDPSNLIRALVYKINHDSGISESVKAYNGNYSLDSEGNKVDNVGSDKFLLLESRGSGEEASFEGRISISRGENPLYKSSIVSTLTDKVDINSLIDATIPNSEHMIIDGETFTTNGEDYASLAAVINASATFTASYDSLSNQLTVDNTSGAIVIDTSSEPTYADIITLIDGTAGYTASEGQQLIINGETFVSDGEDYAALAIEIDSGSFTASFNAGLNELTVNGETFSTLGNTYSQVASLINDSSSFESSTEDRGTITINIGSGVDKVFTVTDTTTYTNLIDEINADVDLYAELSSSGNLVIAHSDGTTPLTITEDMPTSIGIEEVEMYRDTAFKNEYQSQEAENKVYLSVFDSEVNVSSGSIKAQIENLTTTSPNNKIVDYKNKLDDFAKTLSDMYDKYVKTGQDEYTYGHTAIDEYDGTQNIKHINLFSGGDVKSLKFNQNAVNDLLQSDLDYMATMQWKKDIGFDGFAQDGKNIDATSFSEFYQEIRVNISSDKENNDFLLGVQETVQQSLQFSYDQLTKVDKDEEMINLIKFQAAYTANAKIITVVDEMLNTILGIKR